MSGHDKPDRTAEVLRLGLVEGVGVRAIARRLGMARKTVRRILGRSLPQPKAPAAARGSILDAYDATIRSVLRGAPDIRTPAMLERLRPLGYIGGVTILRERLHRLRDRAPREAFLTLDFPPGAAMQVDWARRAERRRRGDAHRSRRRRVRRVRPPPQARPRSPTSSPSTRR
jgi:transposase